MKNKLIISTLTMALIASGCTKKSVKDAVAETTTNTNVSLTANIYGKVSTSSSSQQKMLGHQKPKGAFFKAGDVFAQSVSGCTITAEDLTSGAVVATTTTDSSGNYTLTGVEDGSTYKVIADCGNTGKFSLVSTADSVSVSEKTPVPTNPLSTIIAAQIVKAVIESLDSQLGSLPASVVETLKATILEKIVPVIVALVTSEIEEAVASGAMETPTAEEATTLTSQVDVATSDDATSLDTAITNYETVKPTPPAISQAITGGMANSEVAVNCSNSNSAASAKACTKSLTKLLYTALGFGVIVKVDGTGAFDATTCDSAGIGTQLPNGTYSDLNGMFSSIAANTVCLVESNISRPDRNQNSESGGKDDGPMFSETANLDGAAGEEMGYLTVLGDAMYNGYKYNISDINKFIFSRNSATGAGMDGRLYAMAKAWDSTTKQPKTNSYYRNSSGAWTLVDATGLDQSLNWGLWPIGGCIGDDWAFNSAGTLSHIGNTVSCNATGYQNLVTAIGASDFVTDPVLGKKYYGDVPTQDKLDAYFDEGRMHLDFNPTGQKEFNVLFSEFPVWEVQDTDGNKVRPCDDNDTTTVCGDANGTTLAVKVDITLGSASSTGLRAITSITKATDGDFYMQPVWDQNGFTGIFQFIRASDGMYLRDEFFDMRAIKVVLKSAECGTNSLPAAGSECAAQKVFSVKMSWGNNGVSYSALSSAAITVEMNGQSGNDSVPVQTQVKQNWQNSFSGSGWHPAHVAYGSWDEMTDISVSLSNDSSTSSAPVITAGTNYSVSVYFNCDQNPCTQSYYLVDSNERPLNTTGIDTYCSYTAPTQGSPQGSVDTSKCLLYGYWDETANNNMGNWVQKATYKLNADGSAFGTTQLDGSGSNDITWADDVAFYMVASGPTVNHASRCSFEPFFVDGNANGTLDCATDDLSATGGDVTFSSDWEVQNYISKNPTAQYSENNNGYSFSDPAGAKKLMNTAFPGWFDGTHTIDSNTEFDGLQGLALIYLYFEEGGGSGGSSFDDSTAPANAKFSTFIPKMDGGGGDGIQSVLWFNKAFGAGLTSFKRN